MPQRKELGAAVVRGKEAGWTDSTPQQTDWGNAVMVQLRQQWGWSQGDQEDGQFVDGEACWLGFPSCRGPGHLFLPCCDLGGALEK